MRVKLLLSSVAVAGAMWVSTSVAHAYGFNANPVFPTPNSGSFHVLVQRVSGHNNIWNVTIKSNQDFVSSSPEHNINMVGLRFFTNNTVLNSANDVGSGAISNDPTSSVWKVLPGWPINPVPPTYNSSFFTFYDSDSASRNLKTG